MFQWVRCAIILGDSQGSAIHQEFVCHHSFGEGDPLPFILGSSSDLTSHVLKAFLKTFEMGQPVKRDLLGNWWGASSLLPVGGTGTGIASSASSREPPHQREWPLVWGPEPLPISES
ncbi:UNVERIFIED_CONTAM: hypothetical protein Slati_3133600 [Sesamum latifolium]|uniref:Uncharacterized protein n=1 Tax=Sesamum latifolium TaxID=2727402 RepID=A0AAW2UVS2_9LAMI